MPPPPVTRKWSILNHAPAGRLTSEVNNATSTTYGYDSNDQLTSAGAESFGYDAAGVRNSTGYSVDAANRMSNDGTWTYSYDAQGQRTKKSKGASQETWTYGYDAAGQMSWAEQRGGDGGTLLLRLDFKLTCAS